MQGGGFGPSWSCALPQKPAKPSPPHVFLFIFFHVFILCPPPAFKPVCPAYFSFSLSNHCTVAWVQRPEPEEPKGLLSRSWAPEAEGAPRLLVFIYFVIYFVVYFVIYFVIYFVLYLSIYICLYFFIYVYTFILCPHPETNQSFCILSFFIFLNIFFIFLYCALTQKQAKLSLHIFPFPNLHIPCHASLTFHILLPHFTFSMTKNSQSLEGA